MTYTTQLRSLPMSSKTSNGDKLLTKEDINLLLSIFDGLNDLYETLNRLNYEIEKKCMEQIACRKGEKK